jgi:hypothetical protein
VIAGVFGEKQDGAGDIALVEKIVMRADGGNISFHPSPAAMSSGVVGSIGSALAANGSAAKAVKAARLCMVTPNSDQKNYSSHP